MCGDKSGEKCLNRFLAEEDKTEMGRELTLAEPVFKPLKSSPVSGILRQIKEI